jgi:glycosyltransferase involved in cell wall biosynthesis
MQIADDQLAVLFFGRLVKEKGLAEFTEIMARARAMGLDVKPLIIGDGPARSSLQNQLPDAIFTGHLTGDELGRAVASADIMINPSISESFGNVTLEAMASQVAVIAADVPSSRFLIDHYRNGIICGAQEIDDYTNALKILVENPDQRMLMAHQAYLESAQHTWERAMGNVVNCYHQLMADKAANRRHPCVNAGII